MNTILNTINSVFGKDYKSIGEVIKAAQFGTFEPFLENGYYNAGDDYMKDIYVNISIESCNKELWKSLLSIDGLDANDFLYNLDFINGDDCYATEENIDKWLNESTGVYTLCTFPYGQNALGKSLPKLSELAEKYGVCMNVELGNSDGVEFEGVISIDNKGIISCEKLCMAACNSSNADLETIFAMVRNVEQLVGAEESYKIEIKELDISKESVRFVKALNEALFECNGVTFVECPVLFFTESYENKLNTDNIFSFGKQLLQMESKMLENNDNLESEYPYGYVGTDRIFHWLSYQSNEMIKAWLSVMPDLAFYLRWRFEDDRELFIYLEDMWNDIKPFISERLILEYHIY